MVVIGGCGRYMTAEGAGYRCRWWNVGWPAAVGGCWWWWPSLFFFTLARRREGHDCLVPIVWAEGSTAAAVASSGLLPGS